MASLLERAHEVWHIGLAGLAFLLSVLASLHVVLYKRDSRRWCCWGRFVAGAPGRRAALLPVRHKPDPAPGGSPARKPGTSKRRAEAAEAQCAPEELHRHLPGHTGHLQMLARVVGNVVGLPLLPGNRIEPLVDGDQADPADARPSARPARPSPSEPAPSTGTRRA